MRKHPRRAEVDSSAPRGWATSDRNGHIGNLKNLKWQWEWAGARLFNKRILVHDDELDVPQRQLGTLVIPPDPIPLINARVENYAIDEEPVSTRYAINKYGQLGGIRVLVTPGSELIPTNRIVLINGGNFLGGGTTKLPLEVGTSNGWNPSSLVNATLSNNNLTVTNTGIYDPSFDAQGALSSVTKSSGKYYIEITYTKGNSGINSGVAIGPGPAGDTPNDFNSNDAPNGVQITPASGEIFANGSFFSFGLSGAGNAVGTNVYGIAIDLNNNKVWFICVSGAALDLQWNGSGTDNPATNSGGAPITVGTKAIFGTFNDTDNTEALTANFGASPFVGTVPAGFTAGWF